jgi:cytochrome c553
MNAVRLTLILALAAIGTGCATQDLRWPHFGADPKTPGKTIALRLCSDCHGLDGNPVSPNFPRLAGQQVDYLIKQLNEFQAHRRGDPLGAQYMWGLARDLTPAQAKEIAVYFSDQKPVPGPLGEPALVNAGRQLFQHGNPDKGVPACASCHGQSARGAGETPRLADQWAHYVEAQLQVFHTQQRPAGVAMHAIVQALTPEDVQALAAYLQAGAPG